MSAVFESISCSMQWCWCSNIRCCLLQIEQYLESQQQGDAEVKAEEEENKAVESGADEEEEEEPEPK